MTLPEDRGRAGEGIEPCRRPGRRAAPLALVAAGLLAAAVPLPVSALETSSAFMFSSELAKRGFVPFAVSPPGVPPGIQSSPAFGMRNGPALCPCMDARLCDDTRQFADKRREFEALGAAIEAAIKGRSPDRTVPTIPFVCVLTQ